MSTESCKPCFTGRSEAFLMDSVLGVQCYKSELRRLSMMSFRERRGMIDSVIVASQNIGRRSSTFEVTNKIALADAMTYPALEWSFP